MDTEAKPECRCVVRLTTSMWRDTRGVHFRKSLMFLRRKSKGFQILEEDVDMIGAEEVVPRVVNLCEADDGIYEVIVCGEQRDWETGQVEEYSYKLVPFIV